MSKWIELISEPLRPEVWELDLPRLDIEKLLPVAIICGISILLSALWLLAVCEYEWLRTRHRP
jgi:hypothetical protein